jgi:acyl carrier protein
MQTPDHEQRVLELVSRRTRIPLSRLSVEDRLLQDLGVDSDDAADLLLELSHMFQIDMTTLETGRHFRPEPNLFSVFRLPRTRREELAEKVPVTIADLIRAAETGKWPF